MYEKQIAICIIVLIAIYYFTNTTNSSNDKDKIIWFYSPGCGYCTNMENDWAIFKSRAPSNFVLEKINTTKNQKMADDFGVEGVPHIVKIKNGKRTVYSGDRSAKDLLKFALE